MLDSSVWVESCSDGPNVAEYEPLMRDEREVVTPTQVLCKVCRTTALRLPMR